MEKSKIYRNEVIGLAAAGLAVTLWAGLHQNDGVESCNTDNPLATTQKAASGYNAATDPEMLIRSRPDMTVNIGDLVCSHTLGDNTVNYYLTDTGLELSRQYQADQPVTD